MMYTVKFYVDNKPLVSYKILAGDFYSAIFISWDNFYFQDYTKNITGIITYNCKKDKI